MSESKDYQKRLSEIFPETLNEEFKKLQDECNQFKEHCKNFSKIVDKKCEEKITKLQDEIMEDFKKNPNIKIDATTLAWLLVLTNK